MRLTSRGCFLLIGLFIAVSAQADTFISPDVPVAIPDGPSGIANSHLEIPVNYAILDLNLTVTITHPFDGDLRLYLVGPDGRTTIRLANRLGQSGDNYTGTVFDDEASLDIMQGQPPFTGRFAPEQPLFTFDGLGTYGVWTLRVTDNAARDTGTIEGWLLEITLGDPLAAPEPAAWQPAALTLAAAPNPFNPATELSFSLAAPGLVTLAVYDVVGRQVQLLQNGPCVAGEHRRAFRGADLPTGMYFARLEAAGTTRTLRLLLVK